MSEMSKESRPTKVAVTFADGHTEEFDTFVAVVATGLVIAGKDEHGRFDYIAGESGFQTRGIVHINGGIEVAVGLVKTLARMLEKMLPTDPSASFSFLEAFLSMTTEPVDEQSSSEFRQINPEGN